MRMAAGLGKKVFVHAGLVLVVVMAVVLNSVGVRWCFVERQRSLLDMPTEDIVELLPLEHACVSLCAVGADTSASRSVCV